MVTIINTHEVADYNAWKQTFDAGAEARTNAGISIRNICRDTDNSNYVTVVAEAADAQTAKAFTANLRPVLEKAGIDAKIMVLEEVMN